MGQKSHRFSPGEKCQKSNGWIAKIAMEKGSYLFQTVVLGIYVGFLGCNVTILLFS